MIIDFFLERRYKFCPRAYKWEAEGYMQEGEVEMMELGSGLKVNRAVSQVMPLEAGSQWSVAEEVLS